MSHPRGASDGHGKLPGTVAQNRGLCTRFLGFSNFLLVLAFELCLTVGGPFVTLLGFCRSKVWIVQLLQDTSCCVHMDGVDEGLAEFPLGFSRQRKVKEGGSE